MFINDSYLVNHLFYLLETIIWFCLYTPRPPPPPFFFFVDPVLTDYLGDIGLKIGNKSLLLKVMLHLNAQNMWSCISKEFGLNSILC